MAQKNSRRGTVIAPTPLGLRSLVTRDPNYLVLVIVFFIFLAVLTPYTHPIEGDAVFYYAYLPSLLLDHDLDFRNQFLQYEPWIRNWGIDLDQSAKVPNYFPIGTAILWAPFYLAGHAVSVLTGETTGEIPGYSIFHTSLVAIGSFVYALIGLLLLYEILKQLFSRTAALAAVLGVWLGSFLLWYQFIQPYYSHAIDFFLATLFIWLWLKWRNRMTDLRLLIAMGAVLGLCGVVRYQTVALAMLPGLDLLRCLVRPNPGVTLGPTAVLKRLLLVGVLTVSAFLVVQIPIWIHLFGKPYPFSEPNWINPFLDEVLFSTRNGLFTWTPIAWVCAIGLLMFARKNLWLGTLLISFFVVQLYLTTILPDWFAGWSFGMRRLSNCIPILGVGLAAVAERYRERGSVKILASWLSLFLLWNFAMMGDYYTRKLQPSHTFSFMNIVERRYHEVGNPLSFPANWLFALKYGVSPAAYDVLVGDYFLNFGNYGDRLIFGDPRFRPFLVEGWSYDERNSSGISWVWAVGKKARILLPLYVKRDLRLIFTAHAFDPPGHHTDQIMELWVNDHLVGRTKVLPGRDRLHEFEVSQTVLQSGMNQIELLFSSAVSPAALGLSPNPRELSVSFRELRLESSPIRMEGWTE